MDYKEKLEEAKRLYETANADQKYLLESLFPELKSRANERIRKDIISFLRSKNGYMNPNEDWDFRNRWLPWLEKHGEQKVSVVEFNAKDWYVSKVDGKIYNAKFMKKASTNLARKLEIEKAAMSATGIIDREEWFIKGAEWADGNPSYISSEKQGEQNPAWSEEDERTYKSVLYAFKHNFPLYTDQQEFIKSLKDRVQPQQKCSDEAMKYLEENHSPSEVSDFQAAMNIAVAKAYDKGKADAIAEMSIWSENDEEMYNKTINYIKQSYYSEKNVIDWFKSIKDRVQPQSIAYYNPYKEVVESIAEMCKHYDRLDVGSLQDFYDNVKVKCKDAKEYESLFPQNTWKPSEEIMKGLNEIINKLAISPVIHEHGYLYDLMVNLRKKLKGE